MEDVVEAAVKVLEVDYSGRSDARGAEVAIKDFAVGSVDAVKVVAVGSEESGDIAAATVESDVAVGAGSNRHGSAVDGN